MLLIPVLWLAGSCEKEATTKFGEQYKKTIYIVHAQGMEYSKDHNYENQTDNIMISVYCGSTEPITKDVSVTLKLDTHALDSLNHLNGLGNAKYVPKALLPAEFYSLTDFNVTIKKGAQFGVLNIPVHFTGLDADIPYALPITIVSNDANYDINPKLASIVYQPTMISKYSGLYSGTSKVSTETSAKSITPKLKALSANTIRIPIHNLVDDKEFISTNYMLLTIGDDKKSIRISPIGNALVTDDGDSQYDEDLMQFTLHYSYVENGKTKSVHSVIRNVEALEEE